MVEGLPAPDAKDLELLRSTGRRSYSSFIIRSVVAVLGGLAGILITVHLLRDEHAVTEASQVAHQRLVAVNAPWGKELSTQVQEYQDWLVAHGTRTEYEIFNEISTLLIQGVLATFLDEDSQGREGFFSRVLFSLQTGLIRLSFLIIASARAWFVVVIGAVMWGLRSYRPYHGEDALGQMGNGRLFYSGLRAGLEKITAEGAPDVQVRGFACPQHGSSVEARASSMWRVLGEYGAQNVTNEALVAILVKNGAIAPYVVPFEEDAIFAKAFKGSSLLEHTPALLEAALSLHALFAAGEVRAGLREIPEQAIDRPFDSDEYALAVRSAMSRVLSPTDRQQLGQIPASEVATAVLALQCGKVMAHSYEGGRWIKRSQFPNLSARAVLHSVLAYPEDYDFYSRSRIRRALIYASRSSSFAPVRMPIGLPPDVWVLRQWMEVLMANPHELSGAADEVELVGLVRAAHEAWVMDFLGASGVLAPEISGASYATASGLLLVPLTQIVQALRRSVDAPSIARMAELLEVVSARQRLQAAELAKREGEAPDPLSFDRIFPPLRDKETAELANLHALAEVDVRDWSALRIVLTSFGWLARRVGDYTVPESSIIFAVFKSREPLPGANSLGLVGKAGMVPFRGAKLEARWGGSWSARFAYADKATMAEATEDFEKLMKGFEEKIEDDLASTNSPVSA